MLYDSIKISKQGERRRILINCESIGAEVYCIYDVNKLNLKVSD